MKRLFLKLLVFFFSASAVYGQAMGLPVEQTEYSLTEGTQSCPQNISVKKSCRGWVVTDDQENLYQFCNANLDVQKKTLRESSGLKLVISETEHTDSYLKSLTTTILTGAEGQSIIEQENALFWSDDGQILWESRTEQEGMSCLYSQSDLSGSDSLVGSL